MWENVVETDRPQMTIWRKRIAYWIPKPTNTHSEYIIVLLFLCRNVCTSPRLNVTLYVQHMAGRVKHYICLCCYLHIH